VPTLYAPHANSDGALMWLWLDGRLPHTRRAYEGDVRVLLTSAGKSVAALTLGDLQAWVGSLAAMARRVAIIGDRATGSSRRAQSA